jgi:hypothetical protein
MFFLFHLSQLSEHTNCNENKADFCYFVCASTTVRVVSASLSASDQRGRHDLAGGVAEGVADLTWVRAEESLAHVCV